jgi:hypothetical protein
MKPFNRFVACMLVLPTLWLFFPTSALCAGDKAPGKTANKTITRHQPKVMASPVMNMTPKQAAKAEQAKKKKPNWLWIGLGAAALIGLVAAIGGGGGGGGRWR